MNEINKNNEQTVYADQDGRMESKNFKAYVKLRAVTDSIEALSMVYYSKAQSADQRIKRSDEIEAILKPAMRQIMSLMRDEISIDCPEPLKPCGGCCVPYDCSVLLEM